MRKLIINNKTKAIVPLRVRWLSFASKNQHLVWEWKIIFMLPEKNDVFFVEVLPRCGLELYGDIITKNSVFDFTEFFPASPSRLVDCYVFVVLGFTALVGKGVTKKVVAGEYCFCIWSSDINSKWTPHVQSTRVMVDVVFFMGMNLKYNFICFKKEIFDFGHLHESGASVFKGNTYMFPARMRTGNCLTSSVNVWEVETAINLSQKRGDPAICFPFTVTVGQIE